MKSAKKYYDMPFGGACGLLLDEETMKKVAKLIYRQNQELKELLQANIDKVEISNWTLAYPNGKQEAIHYIETVSSYDSKEHRISLIDRMSHVRHVPHVYIGTNDEAKDEHMKLYDGTTPVPLPAESAF